MLIMDETDRPLLYTPIFYVRPRVPLEEQQDCLLRLRADLIGALVDDPPTPMLVEIDRPHLRVYDDDEPSEWMMNAAMIIPVETLERLHDALRPLLDEHGCEYDT